MCKNPHGSEPSFGKLGALPLLFREALCSALFNEMCAYLPLSIVFFPDLAVNASMYVCM